MMISPLATFTLLQLFDALSTLLFMFYGVQEGNPFLRALVPHVGPFVGLFLLKSFGVTFGVLWYRQRRSLVKVNLAYACLVVYNVLAVVLWLHGVR